jgi:hypothetical protein
MGGGFGSKKNLHHRNPFGKNIGNKPIVSGSIESWYDDYGAQQIMESYFSEFADADMI